MNVAFVPIRLNNQRLPNKNLLPLGDKSLCWYIFESILKVSKIDKVCVYCSNEQITKHIPKEVEFVKRDQCLDQNSTLGMEIYQSFAKEVNADNYILCHATSPYLKHKTIELGVKAMTKHDSAFTVQKHQTFSWFKNKPINYKPKHIPHTQDLEAVFTETSGMFAFNKSVLSKNRRIGNNPKMIEVDWLEAIDIDTLQDYQFAKASYESFATTSNA